MMAASPENDHQTAGLVQILGPADQDQAPEGVQRLWTTAPPGHELMVCMWPASDSVLCLATSSPERALAAAHAAAELIEDRGSRPSVVFGTDGRRRVAAAAHDVARQEEDGPHRRLVNKIRPTWERVMGHQVPVTRH